jgi:cell division initiation protein
MRHTPIDIVNTQFPKGVRGYRCEAVRRFLSEVADEFESVIRDRAALLEQVETLRQQIDRYTAMETAIKNAAVTAERNADQTRANAQEEAKIILRDAEQKGRDMIAEATGETARIRVQIDRLRAERDRFVAEYSARLRAELALLDKTANEAADQPAEESGTANDDLDSERVA